MQVDTEALLDSVAVSHVVGVMEATRLLQAWKQRAEKVRVAGHSVPLVALHRSMCGREHTISTPSSYTALRQQRRRSLDGTAARFHMPCLQAAVGAEECRRSWKELEATASQHADEAVRLEERALALEQAGRMEEVRWDRN